MVHSAKTMVTLKQIEFDVEKQTARFGLLSYMYFNVYYWIISMDLMHLQMYI